MDNLKVNGSTGGNSMTSFIINYSEVNETRNGQRQEVA